jgi:large subunit ribosomal protein L25
MAEAATLKINVRKNVSKAENKKLRKDGYLIGNISRKGMDSVAIAVKKDEFRKAIKTYGRNAVLSLVSDDNTTYSAMVKEVFVSPPAYDYSHVDFQQVSLTEEVKAEVAIKFTGTEFLEAKRLIINRIMDTFLVKGLPQNIPDEIEIDVSKLGGGSTLTVGDVNLPEGITTELEANQMILSINEAKVQVEETEEVESEIA